MASSTRISWAHRYPTHLCHSITVFLIEKHSGWMICSRAFPSLSLKREPLRSSSQTMRIAEGGERSPMKTSDARTSRFARPHKLGVQTKFYSAPATVRKEERPEQKRITIGRTCRLVSGQTLVRTWALAIHACSLGCYPVDQPSTTMNFCSGSVLWNAGDL